MSRFKTLLRVFKPETLHDALSVTLAHKRAVVYPQADLLFYIQELPALLVDLGLSPKEIMFTCRTEIMPCLKDASLPVGTTLLPFTSLIEAKAPLPRPRALIFYDVQPQSLLFTSLPFQGSDQIEYFIFISSSSEALDYSGNPLVDFLTTYDLYHYCLKQEKSLIVSCPTLLWYSQGESSLDFLPEELQKREDLLPLLHFFIKQIIENYNAKNK